MISKDTLESILSMYDIRYMISMGEYSKDYLKGIQIVLDALKGIYEEQLKSNSDKDSLVTTWDDTLGWIKREK